MHASYSCFVWLIVPQFIFYIYVEASTSIGKTYSINNKHVCICTHSSPLYTIKVDCCISYRSQYDRRHITQIALYSVLVHWLYTGETETNGMINDTPTYHDVPTYRVPTYPYPLPSIGRELLRFKQTPKKQSVCRRLVSWKDRKDERCSLYDVPTYGYNIYPSTLPSLGRCSRQLAT